MPAEQTTYFIDGLCCADEENLLRKKLGTMNGVGEMRFNLVARKLMLTHTCTRDDIARSIREVGFTPKLDTGIGVKRTYWERNAKLIYTAASAFLMLAGILLDAFSAPEIAAIAAFILSALAGGWQVAIRGFKAVKHRSLEMNFLMTVATIGAMAIGKWTEGAAIVMLFSFSQVLEAYSMERTRRAIRTLMDVSPARATVKRDGFEFSVPVEEIGVGERLVVRPGERIALDGTIVAGESTVNQSPITGESMPVRKRTGDEAFAGTLNERGHLEITVTHRYYDTVLSHIVQTVEDAQAERAPAQNFVERFSHYYSPAIFILAVAVALMPPLLFGGLFSVWFYRALVLLVIGCPCALVISTPVTIVSGLTNAARNGILIKGGRHLESIAGIQAVAFDKTGTLTKGTPRVTNVIPLNSLTEKEILGITASIEAKSGHHLAGAILAKAAEEGIDYDRVSSERFETFSGRGIKAEMNGTAYIVGNHEFVEEHRICNAGVERVLESLEAEGKTAAILCTDREPLGIIAIEDTLRPETPRVIRRLHNAGIKKVILLTGDNKATANAIAGQAGIDEVHAGIMPADKVREVKRLQEEYGSVAMVGDGMNDAPALAASTVGIAMGRTGSDLALETADIVLMSDELSRIPYTVSLGKRAMAVIKQNIAFAVALKVVFLVLGVFGMTSLWLAVLADDGATLLVILNGLTLLWNVRNGESA